VNASHATALYSDTGQVFLESVRFDCVGLRGREQIVSLKALRSEYVSSPGAWPGTARRLAAMHYIDEGSHQEIEKVWAFGRLIANSDMHGGNLSFYLSGAPMKMAPVYDMLPMAFAPANSGAMRNEAVDINVDSAVSKTAWEFALPLAGQFWQQVLDDKRISAGFQDLARAMLEKLALAALIIHRLA
jgi:hypothetical protein